MTHESQTAGMDNLGDRQHLSRPANVLLLTATIEPSARMPGNLRADPAIRRRDYETALAFYLSLPDLQIDRIVFAENSGADLTSLEELGQTANPHGRALDMLSYVSDCPPERGKGYAELEILDRTYNFLAETMPGDTKVWKITGRLIVVNLDRLIATAPTRYDVYGDFREVPVIGEKLGGNEWLDTRTLSFSLDGYRRWLFDEKAKSSAFPCIEKQLFATLRPHLSDPDKTIVPRMRHTPRLKGICAGSNKDYDALEYRVKHAVRRVARGIAPGLWL